MTNLSDLFIGAVNTDTIAVLDYDDGMFGATDTFAGSDSDVLLLDGAEGREIDADETFETAADDADVIAVAADSDVTFDVSDDSFDADDDADLIGDAHDDFLFID